ncbi:MAG: FtsQ-type POTRA domain-containing protein [Myxococcales bacterium]|nr:FtsQ-type POTRA domain-containing protein [Myxococcales bacterium]
MEDDTAAGRPIPATELSAIEEDAEARAAAKAERRARLKAQLSSALSTFSMVALVAGSLVVGRVTHRWATTTPRFGAREIEVVGAQRTTRAAVLDAANIHDGRNVLSIDLRKSERGITELPWVARAQVSRRLPGHVRIEIEEREAVAIVSSGGQYLCASDGTIFKRIVDGDPADLPVITGIARELFARDPELAKEQLRDALALLSDLAGSSLGGRVRVDEVHHESTGDLSMTLAGRGTYVWLGRGPYRAKMARLSAILTELERNHLDAAEIHLESDRHPERAAVRLRVR